MPRNMKQQNMKDSCLRCSTFQWGQWIAASARGRCHLDGSVTAARTAAFRLRNGREASWVDYAVSGSAVLLLPARFLDGGTWSWTRASPGRDDPLRLGGGRPTSDPAGGLVGLQPEPELVTARSDARLQGVRELIRVGSGAWCRTGPAMGGPCGPVEIGCLRCQVNPGIAHPGSPWGSHSRTQALDQRHCCPC